MSRIITNKRIAWAGHTGLNKRCDAVMYRYDTDAGDGLASGDADITLTQMDIRFL